MTATQQIEVINCNHGGFYSVHDWTRDDGMFGHMLGQVQRLTPSRWAARRHGHYRDENPPTFATRREAVAHLAAS
jgi:hypothetical protein